MSQLCPAETAPANALGVEIKQVAETVAAFLKLLEGLQATLDQPEAVAPAIDLPPLSGVGERIRFVRMVRGLSQAELADRVGLSRATVNYSEKGKSHPNGATAFALAHALGCNHFWLVTGLGNHDLLPHRDLSA